jgi:hypothetical protein
MSFLTNPSTTQSVTIKPGEKYVLPAGAVITSVGKEGDVTATTDCPDVQQFLDAAESYECYSFTLSCDNSSSSSFDLLDENSARVTHIKIASKEIAFLPIGVNAPGLVINWMNGSGANDYSYIKDSFEKVVDPSLIKVLGREYYTRTKYKEIRIIVKMLPSIAAGCEIRIHGLGFEEGAWVKPAPRSNCTIRLDNTLFG